MSKQNITEEIIKLTPKMYAKAEPLLDSLGIIYSANPLEEKAYRILRLSGFSELDVKLLLKKYKVKKI